MRVISYDCAFSNLGYAVMDIVDDNIRIITTGVVKTEDTRQQTNPKPITKTDKNGKATTTKPKRKRKGKVSDEDIRRITDWSVQFCCLIRENNIECVVAELPAGAQDARAATTLGFSKGMCIMGVVALGISHVWVTPGEVKDMAKELLGRDKKTADPGKKEIIDLVVDLYKGEYDGWPYKHYKNGKESHIIVGECEHLADSVIIAHVAKGTEAFKELEEQLR